MRRKVVARDARLRETARHAPRFRHPVFAFREAFRVKNGLPCGSNGSNVGTTGRAPNRAKQTQNRPSNPRAFALESFFFFSGFVMVRESSRSRLALPRARRRARKCARKAFSTHRRRRGTRRRALKRDGDAVLLRVSPRRRRRLAQARVPVSLLRLPARVLDPARPRGGDIERHARPARLRRIEERLVRPRGGDPGESRDGDFLPDPRGADVGLPGHELVETRARAQGLVGGQGARVDRLHRPRVFRAGRARRRVLPGGARRRRRVSARADHRAAGDRVRDERAVAGASDGRS